MDPTYVFHLFLMGFLSVATAFAIIIGVCTLLQWRDMTDRGESIFNKTLGLIAVTIAVVPLALIEYHYGFSQYVWLTTAVCSLINLPILIYMFKLANEEISEVERG